MKMNVNVNGKDFSAVLCDTVSARALADMMKEGPVTVNLHDFAGFEKVGPLHKRLPSSDVETSTGPGDIVLYQSSQIVMFYGNNAWAYTRIGRIEDLSGWREALGSGDVMAVLSLV